jgi:dTDP-4-dehydrorhamnose 3,5-epimerase
MRFEATAIDGAFLISLEPHGDERGFFARAFCAREFRERGLNAQVAQCNLCHNRHKGTLRGLHYQTAPALESKLVRCLRGEIHDVIVDLRPESPSYLLHVAVKLSAENRLALFVPPLCAHGYQTLTDDVEILYQTGEFYSPECERGLRYDDPALQLKWPLPVEHISPKDSNWPLLGKETISRSSANPRHPLPL